MKCSRNIRITVAEFSQEDFGLRVIDNAEEGVPRFKNLEEAMTLLGGVAGTNGGFFVRDPFSPFGLMVSGSNSAGQFDPNSWMNAVFVVNGGRPSIESSSSFVLETTVTDAIQAGPMLVKDGHIEATLDQGRLAKRTFLARDGAGHWALGMTSECSLHELGLVLLSDKLTSVIHVQSALNLDGGPSTGFWASTKTQQLYKPERWPVRNYIGVFRRNRVPDK